jgi:PAS domain S-box-containing protein
VRVGAVLRAREISPNATAPRRPSWRAVASNIVEALAPNHRVGDAIDATLLAILDAQPGGHAYITREQRYHITNAAFRSWFGSVTGKHVRDVIGAAAYELERASLETALAGAPVSHDARIPDPEGRLRWVRTRYVPHVHGGEVVGVIASIEDVTEQKLAEEHLRILAHASKSLAGATDLRVMAREIAAGLVPILGDWCGLFVEVGGGLTEILAPALPEHDITERAESLAHHAAGEHALVSRWEDGAAIVVPLVGHGTRIGIAVIGAANADRWAPEDVHLVEELARRAGIALQSAVLLQEQREVNERLREADRRKDEFLAVLGHELRNPLAPIVTALDLLELRGAGFARERDVIRRHAEYMTRLVDDLLDVSRITRGKIDLNREPLVLASLIARAVEVTSPVLETRTHQLTIDVPEGLHVFGDAIRLTQVFSNLMINAAKYTPPHGRIEVSAHGDDQHVIVAVKDNGMGIPPELMPTMFEPFVQGARTVERAKGGLGLGLALVKSLTQLHDGTVTAQSKGSGQGSTFVVTLPRHWPERMRHGGSATVATAGRLLLVEDNVDTAMIYGELLRQAGYEVSIAYDGPRALELAHHVRPELAVLDIGLPVMDGYELARHLREQFSSLRMIAVSGYGQNEDAARSREAGFEAHLAKPVDVEDLIRVLQGTVT